MRINHVNIVVSDMERSVAFYVGLLGLQVIYECELEGEWIESVAGLPGVRARCVFVQPSGGGARFELLQYLTPQGATLPEDSLANTMGLRHVAFEVDDLDALYSRLCAAGVSFVSPPVTVPFMVVGNIRKRLCYLYDPDGALLEIADYRQESFTQ